MACVLEDSRWVAVTDSPGRVAVWRTNVPGACRAWMDRRERRRVSPGWGPGRPWRVSHTTGRMPSPRDAQRVADRSGRDVERGLGEPGQPRRPAHREPRALREAGEDVVGADRRHGMPQHQVEARAP